MFYIPDNGNLLSYTGFFSAISYLPVALYAEKLRISSALITAIGPTAVVPRPMTGSIKDINRLWNLTPAALLSGPIQSRAMVVSQRHGNTFNIVNSVILKSAHLIGKSPDYYEYSERGRPVTVNVSFITPFQDTGLHRKAHRIARTVSGLEVLFLLAIASILIFYRLLIAGSLVILLAIQVILQASLSFVTNLVFAKSEDISEDIARTVAQGAALDVHVVVEHSNASQMDVLVGYSAQLHALTNIPAYARGWRLLLWTVRLFMLVLTGQAALLASLAGRADRQVCGSAIWLILYLLLLIPRHISDKRFPDSVISPQPARVDRAENLGFTGRKPALAFISTLLMSEGKVGRWDWMDVFMPSNQRRTDWQNGLEASGLFQNEQTDEEIGLKSTVEIQRVVDEVRKMRNRPELKRKIEAFAQATGAVLRARPV